MNREAVPGTPAAPPAQTSFAALRHPAYRGYFLTAALAMMADNIEHVISYWLLFERFHSPALGGIAVLTHWLPFLLFSVYAGALADRFDLRRIIQLAQILFMVVSLGWAVLFLTGHIAVWHAVVLLTIHGLAGVLWSPAGQLLVHDIVGPAELQSAVRLNATSRNLGLLLGPAVGGLLMLLVEPKAIGLLINVLFYVPLIIWCQRARRSAPRVSAARRARTSQLADLLEALRRVSSDRTIMLMLGVAAGSSFFIGTAIQAQMPEFAHDLGTGKADISYSVLLGANAAGAFFGGLILEMRALLGAKPQSAIVLAILWCFALLGFAVTQNYVVAVCLMAVAGFLNLAFTAMAQTLVQLHSPQELRGRVIGLYNVAANGMRSFSGVTIGMLGALIGIHWSLALSALAMFAVAMVLLAFGLRFSKQ